MINIVIGIVFCIGIFLVLKNIAKGFEYVLIIRIIVPTEVSLNIGIDLPLVFSLIIVLEIVFLIKYLFFHSIKQKKIVKILLLFYFLILIPSLLASEQSLLPQIYILSVMLSTEFLFLLMASQIYDSKEKIKGFVTTFYILFAIMCLYGIFTYIIKINPYYIFLNSHFDLSQNFFEKGLIMQRGGLEGRIQSLMKHTITYSGYLMLFTIFITYYYQKEKNKFYILLLPLLLSNIILTGTKSAIIPLVIYFFILFLNQKKNTKKLKIILISIITFISIISISPVARNIIYSAIYFWDSSKLNELNADTGSSLEFKLFQLKETFRLMNDGSLIFGKGIGYISEYYKTKGFHPTLKGFESLFFKIIVESGIFGIIPWFILYYSLFALTPSGSKNIYQFSFKRVSENFLIFAQLLFSLMTGTMHTTIFLFVLLAINNNYKKINLNTPT